jgi:hypothetical protein
MANTRLILHVKGTDAETKELPKEDVKTALAEGRLSQSQLIWSAIDQAWKQARELPELAPGETLILHVKGTESQTRELPKPAVREGISKGEITHSQLIWSPGDAAWKAVREIPDLLPGETLILHVKGTESQTRELPKPAIRAAISKGEITHSQLIWSAAENQWKQVRDLPELLPSQQLAPAPARNAPVPMLENTAPTVAPATVPAARAAVAASAPGAVVTPRARPAVEGPPRVTIGGAAAVHTPQVKIPQPSISVSATSTPIAAAPRAAVPSAAVRAAVATAPKVAAAMPAMTQASGPHMGHVVKEDEEGAHPLKWICIGMAALIFLIVASNYSLVDRRLQSNYADTSYAGTVGVYAHYAAFLQPNVIVIHIPPSDKLTPENFSAFLVALAHATPANAIGGDPYERIALTSAWTAQYSFAGSAWKRLGEMQAESPAAQKEAILSDVGDASGQPLLPPSTLNSDELERKSQQAWTEFAGHFTKP